MYQGLPKSLDFANCIPHGIISFVSLSSIFPVKGQSQRLDLIQVQVQFFCKNTSQVVLCIFTKRNLMSGCLSVMLATTDDLCFGPGIHYKTVMFCLSLLLHLLTRILLKKRNFLPSTIWLPSGIVSSLAYSKEN